MPKQHGRGRGTSWVGNRLPINNFADPLANADAIRAILPSVIEKAETAGLSLIAAHLGKALRLAELIGASRQQE